MTIVHISTVKGSCYGHTRTQQYPVIRGTGIRDLVDRKLVRTVHYVVTARTAEGKRLFESAARSIRRDKVCVLCIHNESERCVAHSMVRDLLFVFFFFVIIIIGRVNNGSDYLQSEFDFSEQMNVLLFFSPPAVRISVRSAPIPRNAAALRRVVFEVRNYIVRF